jgi:hypothetical protein
MPSRLKENYLNGSINNKLLNILRPNSLDFLLNSKLIKSMQYMQKKFNKWLFQINILFKYHLII